MIFAKLLAGLLPFAYGRFGLTLPLLSQQLHISEFATGDVIRNLADAVFTMPLTLALHPNNKAGLVNILMDISDPSSIDYGKHLSKSEVRVVLGY